MTRQPEPFEPGPDEPLLSAAERRALLAPLHQEGEVMLDRITRFVFFVVGSLAGICAGMALAERQWLLGISFWFNALTFMLLSVTWVGPGRAR